MQVSYKNLWKTLIDMDISKGELRERAGISTSTLAKLGRNENVTVETLLHICDALNCDISKIVQFVPSDGAEEHD